MDYEEDDDLSFAKWMSSFWGHSVTDERESRAHRKQQTRSLSERRASLPVRPPFLWEVFTADINELAAIRYYPHLDGSYEFPMQQLLKDQPNLAAKLSSIHMTRLHGSTKIPSSGHLKELQEDQDTKCHCHMKASKKSSNGNSSQGTSGPNSRSNSIQEFSESFEKQLHFKNKRSVSLEPEGMKERREREKLHIPKSRSRKKVGEKEPKREQGEGEHNTEFAAGRHS